MSDVRMTLRGSEALATTFNALAVDLRKKFMRTELRKSTKRLRGKIADAAPVATGRLQLLMRDAKIMSKVDSRGLRFGVVMPTREELAIPADAKGYYPFAVEYGYTKKDGTRVPANSFIRGTVDREAKTELQLIGKGLGKRIEKEARRRARAAGVRL